MTFTKHVDMNEVTGSFNKEPVVAIFDVGKTNKKLFLFNQDYKIVFEHSAKFLETVDEDNDPCENLGALKQSMTEILREVFADKRFDIKAINITTYGASFVYLNEEGKELTPLYNYLKLYPDELKKQFYDTYGGENVFSLTTASPVLGSLNSGMQLYRLKYKNPSVFAQVKYAMHLPQYISFQLSGKACADITSIGCHTNLWDFQKNKYHSWVKNEGVDIKLPEILPADVVLPVNFEGHEVITGIGLHDSSAAIIPYLVSFKEPFVLISTGTWCITLNPFNDQALTEAELKKDCLCYLSYKGTAVKASRLFSGYIHDQQVIRISMHFKKSNTAYKNICLDKKIFLKLSKACEFEFNINVNDPESSVFAKRDLNDFENYEEAYHQLVFDLVKMQVQSSKLVINNNSVKIIFVDGGFSKNNIFMNLLAIEFPEMKIYAASLAQATALGAALVIHTHWNVLNPPSDMIQLKHYST